MRILMVVDKEGSAIWRLAVDIKERLPHLKIEVADVHPKRPDPEQLRRFESCLKDADIVSWEYWKTAEMLRDIYADELVGKKQILCHYNPYNVNEMDWKGYDLITVCNKEMKKMLPQSHLIPLMIDTKKFEYKRDITSNKIVQMVSSRIEGKKGVLPVALACKQLGLKLLLIGSISDGEYFKKIMETGVVEFRERVSEKELVNSYYEATVHFCNSVDGYESGTMPILEAMACGTPVLTRPIGHVPDFGENGSNMVIRTGEPEDISGIKQELKALMGNENLREEMRDRAWKTVKTRDSYRRARMYERMFYKVLYKQDLVSIIIPTYNRKEILAEILAGVLAQDWPALEIIVVDDGSDDGTGEFVKRLQEESPRVIKYLNTGTPDVYNLGHARNLGTIEALADVVVYLDDRYKPDSRMVSKMLEKLQPKAWVYGSKGYDKGFIENVSCIHRQEMIEAGMFNEAVKLYGFQTQELRARFLKQGFRFIEAPEATVEILVNTKSKYTKKEQIIDSKNILWQMNL